MGETEAERTARLEAEAWWVRLGVLRASTDTIHAFFDWRTTPLNRAAYEAVERRARWREALLEAAERR